MLELKVRRTSNLPATFAFPSVVALAPGSYAARAIIGGIQILRSGANAPGPLVAETMSLVIYTVVLTSAIALGLAIALAAPLPSWYRRQNQSHP